MRILLIATVVAAVLAAGAGGATSATRECDGLQVCVPVAGPWVIVPTARGASRPTVEYQLSCPKGYIVGGLDAELSRRGVDVSFGGRLGSPVNPGITTSRAVVFVGSYVGTSARGPTFRPHIGCMPASGGGARVPTSTSVFRPGEPPTRRARTVRVRPGSATVVARCRAGERLVGSAHAFGFFMRRPPEPSLATSVSGARSVAGGRVTVRVRADAELGNVRAVVQVQAVCSRER